MVIPPAKTGNDNNNKTAVIKTDQTNSGNLYMVTPLARILIIVTIKLMAPIKDEAPAICKLKMAKSTAGPEWATTPESGGYNVQPVPAPTSATLESNSNTNEGINSQKLILFKRGKAISGAPINIGTNQFPKPPIKIGITIKKIINKAWAVTTTLYN
jgi:hypothetical protein